MDAQATDPVRRPEPLSTGRYVALIGGVCVVIAVAGALAKNYVNPAGFWAGWGVAFAVIVGICVAVARTVGNPTAPVICGVFVGMGAMAAGEEAGRTLGEWGQFACKYLAFFITYFLWATVIHKRIAAWRLPPPV